MVATILDTFVTGSHRGNWELGARHSLKNCLRPKGAAGYSSKKQPPSIGCRKTFVKDSLRPLGVKIDLLLC